MEILFSLKPEAQDSQIKEMGLGWALWMSALKKRVIMSHYRSFTARKTEVENDLKIVLTS